MPRPWLPSLVLAALALAACRPKLAPIDPPEQVAPKASPPPSMTVCWVESGRFGPATASALVIRHPAGTVLVDAGDSSQFDAEVEVYDGPTKRRLKRLPGLLRPKIPFDAQLRAIGVDPEGIAWFIPTHAHVDHIGG
ncbi:MAG: MBL fold metallo-hydrolase, partial [Myxococcales bacterium]|nr:MBL fold metallo-hydrolase [Myxococcales bacterium]